MSEEKKESLNFIEHMVAEDIATGKHTSPVTRFPPEPNGYLHIGHAKAICVNFGIAQKFGGTTNLRFDDTNPTTEDTEFVNSIQRDIKWLGFEWNGDALFTSDYFPQLYAFAVKLIEKGLAYVDDSTAEEIAIQKGDPTRPGTESPYRTRSIEENLDLFTRMKAGEFADGSRVLRVKIDMTSPNMHFRDPVIYRIKHETHHRTGDEWCIYPMYDFAHGQSDSIENITHSLCSLEFKNHRPLYDWLIEKLDIYPSKQTEFARMNVAHMITSKRKLKKLVEEGLTTGWDDPRMPTLSGMRRRGIPPAAIREFCDKAGVAKRENLIEMELFDFCTRQELNKTSDRVMAVLDPIKLVITNYPEGQTEIMSVENNPEEEVSTYREVPFSREIWVERNDFKKEPQNRKYFRLAPGKNVRLKGAYIIHCDGFDEDENGNVTQINCTYYDNSKSGSDTSGVKAKGTLHWVSIEHAAEAEVRLYDRLFSDPTPTSHEDKDFLEFFNKESLKVISKAYVEPSLTKSEPGTTFQFIRIGYFATDTESTPDKLIFNRTVTLRDTWAKLNK